MLSNLGTFGKRFLCAVLVTAGSGGAALAAYPERAIRIVVPSAAGGSPDAMMRLLGAELSKSLGQGVIVDNKPGAGGQIGMSEGARSAPDGYTLTYGNVATLSINQSLFGKLSYNAERDFVPVALVAFTQNALVVRADSPIRSVKDLVEAAKKKPGQMQMGSPGNGTTGHLGGELFKSTAGIFATHIPYRGSPPAIVDLLGGQTDFMFDNLASIGTQIRSGKVRALAVSGSKRSPLFPDVPTMAEAGLPGYVTVAWGGLVAPAGTPKEIVQKLNAEINRIMLQPAVRAKFADIGFEPSSGPPEALTELARKEAPVWAEVVRRSDAKVD